MLDVMRIDKMSGENREMHGFCPSQSAIHQAIISSGADRSVYY
jgi:hypothetical protein